LNTQTSDPVLDEYWSGDLGNAQTDLWDYFDNFCGVSAALGLGLNVMFEEFGCHILNPNYDAYMNDCFTYAEANGVSVNWVSWYVNDYTHGSWNGTGMIDNWGPTLSGIGTYWASYLLGALPPVTSWDSVKVYVVPPEVYIGDPGFQLTNLTNHCNVVVDLSGLSVDEGEYNPTLVIYTSPVAEYYDPPDCFASMGYSGDTIEQTSFDMYNSTSEIFFSGSFSWDFDSDGFGFYNMTVDQGAYSVYHNTTELTVGAPIDPFNMTTLTINGASLLGNIVVTVSQNANPETTPPTYSTLTFSTTISGSLVEFAITGNDNVNLSYAIFTTNNTGTWVPTAPITFTSTPQTVNVSKVLTSTTGVKVGYRWLITDTSGNINDTGVHYLTTTSSGYITPPVTGTPLAIMEGIGPLLMFILLAGAGLVLVSSKRNLYDSKSERKIRI
jgi:hypothetical protein